MTMDMARLVARSGWSPGWPSGIRCLFSRSTFFCGSRRSSVHAALCATCSSHTPQAVVDQCFTRLQDESYLAFLDTMLVRARPHRVESPVLVLGAERDAILTTHEVQATARAYGGEAEISPRIGHDMMLDDGWEKVADRVDAWARGRREANRVTSQAQLIRPA
jgi:pimeloyl-ACP methyl ester carboxylesterase